MNLYHGYSSGLPTRRLLAEERTRTVTLENSGADYLSRGVELQLQICATAIFTMAFFNLLYGLPATHRRGESLFPYLLKRDDDISNIKGRSAVVRAGAARPEEGQLFV